MDKNETSEIQAESSISKVGILREPKVHLILAIMTVAGFIGGYFTHAYVQRPEALGQVSASSSVETQSAKIVINVDDDPFIGPADAPITIVEFSDYECPFCKRFRDQTLNQLLSVYEGQIRFVYRDFPLSQIHPRAQIAAEVAHCAGDQGHYWAMHDILFAEQQNWSKAADVFARFKLYANELEMDVALFTDCIKSGKYTQEVKNDYQEGAAYGVTGTPAFFVNGKFIAGAVPFQMFQAIIERELFALSDG